MGYIDIDQKREAAREYYRRKYQESARFRVKEADRKAEWFNFDADQERLEELKRERDRKRRARLAR